MFGFHRCLACEWQVESTWSRPDARTPNGTSVVLAALIALVALPSLSCIPYDPLGRCTSSYPGITVYVLDAESSEYIENAVVTASEGEYSEVLVPAAYYTFRHEGVYRAGTYDVKVTASGFQKTIIRDIWVPAERYACQDYVPVDIVVRMAPYAEGEIVAD